MGFSPVAGRVEAAITGSNVSTHLEAARKAGMGFSFKTGSDVAIAVAKGDCLADLSRRCVQQAWEVGIRPFSHFTNCHTLGLWSLGQQGCIPVSVMAPAIGTIAVSPRSRTASHPSSYSHQTAHTPEDWETQAPYSYSLTAPSKTQNDHPHASLKAKLRRVARKSLLKEYAPHPKQSLKNPKTPPRPKMRMKDSDDYITARAANPRTGLISPSVAGTPRTPETPAEALRSRPQHDGSPLQDIKPRPALSRANESRKISGGALQRWRADENGWTNEALVVGTVASPRQSDAVAGAALNVRKRPVDGDRFIVHMPSAQEPQPYAYPGRTAKEIEVFEHYRSKARKTSGEGWDQGCVHSGGIRKTSADAGGGGGGVRRTSGGVARRNVSGEHAQALLRRDITAIRHPIQAHELETMDGAAFAPYQSPKTPARKTSVGCARPMRPMQTVRPIQHQPIPRKPIGTAIDALAADGQLSDILPQVNIRHPALASLPMAKLRPATQHPQTITSTQGTKRKCSLGCADGICQPLTPTKHNTSDGIIFERRAPEQVDLASLDLLSLAAQAYTHLKPTLTCLLASAKHFAASLDIKLPQLAPIAALRAKHSTPQQKVDALRSLLALGGQILAVLVGVSIAWKLCVAVGQVLALVLWPLVVPLRILRWIVIGR